MAEARMYCWCQLPWSSHGNEEHAEGCPVPEEECIFCDCPGRDYDGHCCEDYTLKAQEPPGNS